MVVVLTDGLEVFRWSEAGFKLVRLNGSLLELKLLEVLAPKMLLPNGSLFGAELKLGEKLPDPNGSESLLPNGSDFMLREFS